MFNKFSSRIFLAWIVLGLAMILLTLSVSFAQSVSVERKDNGEVKFKYKSTNKKNSEEIDTTFTAKTDEEFYAIMKDISDRHDLDLSLLNKEDIGDIHVEFNRSMKDFDAEMKELKASFANMKFEMRFDDDLNIPDSLDNVDHVIVFGDKGEKAPELETVITDENGRQVFIYKRRK